MVQRQNHAPGTQLNSFRDHGQRRARHGRIWKHSSEGMKMAFRGPDGAESMFVRQFCSLQQQTITIRLSTTCVAGEVEQAVVQLSFRWPGNRLLASESAILRLNYDLEAACQRPKEFQHADIE